MRNSVRLPVLSSTSGDAARRWTVLALAVAAIGLWAAAFFQPWWHFTLLAPQYPHGLTLSVSLTGVGGDVHEINMLNPYHGMGHLEEAAHYERALAPYGLAGLAGLVLVLALAGGKHFSRWLWLPAFGLVGGFIGDNLYWLYHYGHHLNPKAPLHISPFTPHLFGPGTIGQFHTTAVPAAGFALAFLGLALLAVAALLRTRVCRECDHAEQCHIVCPRLFIGPRKT
jgi:hypothetical protein